MTDNKDYKENAIRLLNASFSGIAELMSEENYYTSGAAFCKLLGTAITRLVMLPNDANPMKRREAERATKEAYTKLMGLAHSYGEMMLGKAGDDDG